MANYTLAQLNTELTTDPTTIGYAANITSLSDGAIGVQINTIQTGSAYTVNREPISVGVFTALIDLGEYSANATQAQRDYLKMLIGSNTVDLNNSVIKSALNGLFVVGTYPITRARLIAALTRQGSRAEVLWGAGVNVSTTDISHALRGGTY